jgi:hypothetical protein
VKKPIQHPCKGYDCTGYVDQIDRTNMIGRCTFPKCNAEVKVYKNDRGVDVSKYHRYQANPQWSQFMHNRTGGPGPSGLSKEQ